MKRSTLKKVLFWTGGILLIFILIVLALIQFTWDRKFNDVPLVDLRASTDSALIARGKYLAFGPAHCADCHSPVSVMEESMETGEMIKGYPPLSGGFSYTFDLGTLHFSNITPDSATGIGKYSDGQIARMLRHAVRPNGQATLPIMEYQNISDEDIIAILSFLRSQEPVENMVPEHEYNFMGKMVKAFMIRPVEPDGTPPAKSPPESVSLERGEYLANRVSQCAQCHTNRDPMDFSYIAPRFSGGMELIEPWAPDRVFRPPNLTPDKETGHIVNWTEEQFVARFRAGPVIKGSPMPWNFFARMSDEDLRSIYMYLMSLEPVYSKTGPTMSMIDQE